jgi:hypothetical protein
MSERPTPETNKLVSTWTSVETLLDFARRLERERDDAREELEDWHNAAKGAENPCPDEKHCTCVPLLRKLLHDAQKEVVRLKNIEP